VLCALPEMGSATGCKTQLRCPRIPLDPSTHGEHVYPRNSGNSKGRSLQTQPSALPVGGIGAPSEPDGAAIKARCRRRVETAAGRKLRPPQAAHRHLVQLAVHPSASCAPIPSVTDAQDTHYRIVTLSVENMAEEPRWKKTVKDAAEIVKEAEDLVSNNDLHFPNDLILKLVKAAKDLQTAHQESGEVDESPATMLLDKIKAIFNSRVSHNCEIDEDGDCAMCTGIIEVKEM